jgi:hypothetical protein
MALYEDRHGPLLLMGSAVGAYGRLERNVTHIVNNYEGNLDHEVVNAYT